MELDIVRLGERGQVVIPQEMRNQLHLKKREKLLVVKSDNKIIFEPIKEMKAKMIDEIQEDMIDIKIAEKYWDKVKRGETIKQTKDEFLKELEKW